MHERFTGKKERDMDKMLPWSIYCLKYGRGAEGEAIVRDLIQKGEVFVKQIDGSIFAGHREMSQVWEKGHVASTDLNKVGSSASGVYVLLWYMFLSFL